MFEFGADRFKPSQSACLLLMVSTPDIMMTQLNHSNLCLYVIGGGGRYHDVRRGE